MCVRVCLCVCVIAVVVVVVVCVCVCVGVDPMNISVVSEYSGTKKSETDFLTIWKGYRQISLNMESKMYLSVGLHRR